MEVLWNSYGTPMEQEACTALAIPEQTAVLAPEWPAKEAAETQHPKTERRLEPEARGWTSNNGSIRSSGTTPARCST